MRGDHSTRGPVAFFLLTSAVVVLLFVVALIMPGPLVAQPVQPSQGTQVTQTLALFRWELQTIYLTNLERRQAGLAPLRWNRELTESARWFARDAVDAQPSGYCDHVDSQQRGPGQRMRDYGFADPSSWAENAVCGYTSPDGAVRAWMNSASHKKNILNPSLREIGIGYYKNSAGRGYIVQDMTSDLRFAPFIIDNEAISTTTPQVTLYIYDQSTGGEFAGVGPTQEIMVANAPDFAGAAWEPYAVEKSWTLAPGEGLKTVYVRTRDRQGRTTYLQDSIYLGATVPDSALALEQATAFTGNVHIDAIEAGGYSLLGLSLNWLADDADPAFEKIFGNGERVDDSRARGGTAYRMYGADRNTFVALYSARYFRELSSVAYFRIKTADNSGQSEMVRLVVNDGISDVASRSLRGVDFAAAGEYQEFALPFTLPEAGGGLLALQVYRTGPVDLFLDAVTVHTAPAPWSEPLTWTPPGSYYRSSGVQGRFANPDGAFAAPVELMVGEVPGAQPAPLLQLSTANINLETETPIEPPATVTVAVQCLNCGEADWESTATADWLSLAADGEALAVTADCTGLAPGLYYAEVVVTVTAPEGVAPQTIQVSLLVGDPETVLGERLYMPLAAK